MSDIDTVTVDSLKALDPNRPIREADIARCGSHVRITPDSDHYGIMPTVLNAYILKMR